MIIIIIKNTPIWVWFIFVSLLAYGYFLSKTRIVKSNSIMLLPLVMVVLSLLSIKSAFNELSGGILFWGAGIMAAFLILSQFSAISVGRYLEQDKSYEIFGSWLPLFLMMGIFCTKYVVGVTTAMQLPMLKTQLFVAVICALYGFFSGVFLFRSVSLVRSRALSVSFS